MGDDPFGLNWTMVQRAHTDKLGVITVYSRRLYRVSDSSVGRDGELVVEVGFCNLFASAKQAESDRQSVKISFGYFT